MVVKILLLNQILAVREHKAHARVNFTISLKYNFVINLKMALVQGEKIASSYIVALMIVKEDKKYFLKF